MIRPHVSLRRLAGAFAAALLGALPLTAAAPAAPHATTLLSELDPLSAHQSWGQLATGQSVWGKPMQIGDRKFATGLGTHANSELVYDLEQAYERFEAWIGVDAAMLQHTQASVVFKVLADGRELFNSGVMRADSPARRVSLPVPGVSELKLVVTDACSDGRHAPAERPDPCAEAMEWCRR